MSAHFRFKMKAAISFEINGNDTIDAFQARCLF
jgi:hypothetical protein